MGYVVTGIVCFCLGMLSGVFLICLCAAAKSAETTQENIDDSCHGCFGASFGDCDRCQKNEERGEQ